MVTLVTLACLTNLLFAERILLSEGLGMDGTNYGAIAADIRGEVFERGVNEYYLQRAVPSAIVHYGLRLFGRPTDFAHVVTGFQWYELALLVLVAVMWKPIADELRLGVTARWLGFVGLFVNYANLKHSFYMPVFTDVTAFALGALYLACWLKRRQWELLAVTLLGAFCWPIAALSGAILLAFPRGSVPAPRDLRSRWPTILALGIAAALLAGFSYMYFVRGLRKVGQGPTIPPIEALVPIAMLAYGAWTFGAYRALLGRVTPAWALRVVRGMRVVHVVTAITAVVIPALVIRALAAPDEPILGTRGFLRSVIYLPNARPLVNLVSHVVWFGPVVWLIVFFWRDICAFAREGGPGLIAFLGFSVFIALTPESRQSNLAFPFFVALLCAVARPEWLSARLVGVLAVLSLVFSKFWLRINTDEAIAYALSRARGLSDEQSALQYRLYYLSQGPWMPNRWYVLQGIAVLLAGIVLFALVRRGVLGRSDVHDDMRGEPSAGARAS
jgi:hypothetical protein